MSHNRPVLLVGSINLSDRDEVFSAVSSHLKDQVRSVPDGETGARGTFAAWALNRINASSEVQVVDTLVFETPQQPAPVEVTLLAPAEGVDPAKMTIGPFGYADEAVASYKAFRRAREDGLFGPETRFQISLPTPMWFAMMFVGHRREVLGAIERGMAAEIGAFLEEIPSGDVAIQCDAALETVQLDQSARGLPPLMPEDPWPLEEATESIARLSADIPDRAMLGLHICYGDADGTHAVEPLDLGHAIDIANSASRLIERRLDYVHMPVPIERDDDAYFAPLSRLHLQSETQLYLGLLHIEDGMEGALRRMRAAARHRDDFGIATECGMGREDYDAIEPLLRLHHDAAVVMDEKANSPA
jgi:hypothetical protein